MKPGGRYWLAVALIFAAGLAVHLTVFRGRHREGDELIYQTLVQQLAEGHGYTLHGSWLVQRHLLDAQYDRPLFHHPPGGVLLFWLFRASFGRAGFALAQLASFALFFWSSVVLVAALGSEPRWLAGLLSAALAATSPIMSHVTTHYWLDGPLLAGVTMASAACVWAVRCDRAWLALLSAVLLGASSWIKPTALLALPAMLALAWVLRGDMPLRRFCIMAGAISLIAVSIHAPWPYWRWVALGSPFNGLGGHADAGRPAQTLIASNAYVRFVTVERPAWSYLTLLPRVFWSLVPALALLPLAARDRATRKLSAALLFWIVGIVGLHVALGCFGYSKVLRYVILASPALLILPAALVCSVWTQLRRGELSALARVCAQALLALTGVGIALELAQGVSVAFVANAALIVPWFGGLAF